MVIAPTLHCAYTRATENTVVGQRSVGDARLNYDELITGWFDHWLKGEAFKEMPRVRYYTMGANKWQTSDVWPPANTIMTPYYLDSKGKANTLNGDGKLVTKKYRKTIPIPLHTIR